MFKTVVEPNEIRRPFARFDDERNRSYDVYKNHGESDNYLTNDLLQSKLNQLNDELSKLITEGEQRFQIHKESAPEYQVARSNQILKLIEQMQLKVQGYLDSDEWSKSNLAEEIRDINVDSNLNLTNTLRTSLSDLVKFAIENDTESGINFELLLEQSPNSVDFTAEIADLEQSVSSIPSIEHNNVKESIERIKVSMPSLKRDHKAIESLNKKANMLVKELEDCNKMLSFQSSKVDGAYAEVDFLYKLAQRAIYESDPLLMVLQRLKGVKLMHDESPNIQTNMDKIKLDAESVRSLNGENKAIVRELKAEMAKEFDQIFKDLDECAKQIASKS